VARGIVGFVNTRSVRLGIAALLVVAAVGFGLRARGQMYDFGVYLTAGGRVVAGENLYRVEDGHWQYKYLPAFAFVIAPLSLLPPVAARAVWFSLSLGLLIWFVTVSLRLLPDQRRSTRFLVWMLILAMGKFYIREIGLGQTNILLALLAMLALDAGRRGQERSVGLLLAAATAVKPYAILFWPWLVARRRFGAAAWFVAGLVIVVLFPALRYGFSGNLDLLRGLWSVVTTSTAPNLAGQDNASLAGTFASWFGVGPLASRVALASALSLVGACVWAFRRRPGTPLPEYLETGVLLFLIPLMSPQGWDYVLLVGTPVVLLLLDRSGEFLPPVRWLLFACLAIAGLSIWDVMGRELYRSFMMARVVTVCALFELALVLHLRLRRLA
jgi:hypothetical protein